jgi:biotin transporter BioY
MTDIDSSSRYEPKSSLRDKAVLIVVLIGIYAGYVLPTMLIGLDLLGRPGLGYIAATLAMAVVIAFGTTRFRRLRRPSRTLSFVVAVGYVVFLVLLLTGALRTAS